MIHCCDCRYWKQVEENPNGGACHKLGIILFGEDAMIAYDELVSFAGNLSDLNVMTTPHFGCVAGKERDERHEGV